MKEASIILTDNKTEFYKELSNLLTGLISDESNWLANASNAAALLFQMLPNINWAGFYLMIGGELVLGPFQGKPACVRIQIGKGVCGTAALTREIQLVEDVEKFPGHIVCDAASQSELVIPIIKKDKLIGVLDVDSPIKRRFDNQDAIGLSHYVDILNHYINWPQFS
jgi:L-methionine (R)-S-oxide reductase